MNFEIVSSKSGSTEVGFEAFTLFCGGDDLHFSGPAQMDLRENY